MVVSPAQRKGMGLTLRGILYYQRRIIPGRLGPIAKKLCRPELRQQIIILVNNAYLEVALLQLRDLRQYIVGGSSIQVYINRFTTDRAYRFVFPVKLFIDLLRFIRR